ncbi:hypothetical protein ApAK_07305 [Thermoplasmatales archaeon AK]|nr:hypothetical protein [Thermoplasmatales archaeon AK]
MSCRSSRVYRYRLHLLFSRTEDIDLLQCRICSLTVTRRTARVHAIRRHPGALVNLAKDGKLAVVPRPSNAKHGHKQLVGIAPSGGIYGKEAAQ